MIRPSRHRRYHDDVLELGERAAFWLHYEHNASVLAASRLAFGLEP